MKKVFTIIPAMFLLFILASPVAAWTNLTVSGTCLTNGNASWTISAEKSSLNTDNLIEVSTTESFTAITPLTLDSKTLSVKITNKASQIWARWTNDHNTVTASAVLHCTTPKPSPKATPPMTNTTQTTSDQDVQNTSEIFKGLLSIAAIISVACLVGVYISGKNSQNR